MRCSAAAFLTSEACFVKSDSKTSSAPQTHQSDSTGVIAGIRRPASPRYSRKRTADPSWFSAESAAGRCDTSFPLAQSGNKGASSELFAVRWSNHTPRPVTIRQLYTAVMGVSTAVSDQLFSTACGDDDAEEGRGQSKTSARCQRGSTEPLVTTDSGTHGEEHAFSRNTLLADNSATRIGESTILLDGVPCHTVTVCGRVLKIEAVTGQAARSTWPFSSDCEARVTAKSHELLWISDNTGLVCVLRTRTRRSEAVPPCVDDVMTRGDSTAGNTTASITAAVHAERNKEVEKQKAASQNTASKEATNLTSHLDVSHLAPAQIRNQVTSEVEPIADDHHIPDDADEEFYPNDYVVCTGALAFADVDLQAAAALSHAAEHFRNAAATAVASTVSSTEKGAVKERWPVGSSRGGEATEKAEKSATPTREESQVYVVLPGNEVPLTLETVRTELGLVGPLPARTRYLTAAEASQWGEEAEAASATEGASTEALSSLNKQPPAMFTTSVAETRERAHSCLIAHESERDHFPALSERDANSNRCSAEAMETCFRTCPLFCLKGRPRLILDSNECLFWWLSATETHLRLTHHGQQVRSL